MVGNLLGHWVVKAGESARLQGGRNLAGPVLHVLCGAQERHSARQVTQPRIEVAERECDAGPHVELAVVGNREDGRQVLTARSVSAITSIMRLIAVAASGA